MGGGLELLWWGVKHDDAETGGSKEEICLPAMGQSGPGQFFLLFFLFFSLAVCGTRVVVGAKEQGTELS